MLGGQQVAILGRAVEHTAVQRGPAADDPLQPLEQVTVELAGGVARPELAERGLEPFELAPAATAASRAWPRPGTVAEYGTDSRLAISAWMASKVADACRDTTLAGDWSARSVALASSLVSDGALTRPCSRRFSRRSLALRCWRAASSISPTAVVTPTQHDGDAEHDRGLADRQAGRQGQEGRDHRDPEVDLGQRPVDGREHVVLPAQQLRVGDHLEVPDDEGRQLPLLPGLGGRGHGARRRQHGRSRGTPGPGATPSVTPSGRDLAVGFARGTGGASEDVVDPVPGQAQDLLQTLTAVPRDLLERLPAATGQAVQAGAPGRG